MKKKCCKKSHFIKRVRREKKSSILNLNFWVRNQGNKTSALNII